VRGRRAREKGGRVKEGVRGEESQGKASMRKSIRVSKRGSKAGRECEQQREGVTNPR